MALADVLGPEGAAKVRSSKILVIGAGGIGCEVLKNLVMIQFTDIVVLDLDVIDVTNLNRQFLFRKKHVEKPKAVVAAEVVREFATNRGFPAPNIEALHANIKNEEYGVDFFARFHAVINCLDNLSARRHVNRLCLAAKRPLVEAGTSGYLGQTTVIRGGQTECYECQQKPTPKSFPVCTIRSTPEEPIHCIVWAKQVFEQLFGPKDPENMLSDLAEHLDAVKESTERKTTEERMEQLFKLLFSSQIQELREMWTHKRPAPVALDFPAAGAEQRAASEDRTTVWAEEDCAKHFVSSATKIFMERRDMVGMLSFAKEDPDAVRFVTAASNLRMKNFGIDMKSQWDVESIAGNIVPAIATTNAIVAGLQITNLLHLLTDPARCREVWVRYPEALESRRKGATICTPATLQAPNKQCFVCGTQTIALYLHEMEKWTMQNLAKLLVKAVGTNRPAITHNGMGMYDPEFPEPSEEAAEEGLHPDWTLEQWKISSGTILQVQDESQDFNVDIILRSEELDEEKFPDGYRLEVDDAAPPQPAGDAADGEAPEAQSDGEPPQKKAKSDDTHPPTPEKPTAAA